MSKASRSSEILPSRNLSIAQEPIGRSKFCKKYGVTHIHGIERLINLTKIACFTPLEKAYFKIFTGFRGISNSTSPNLKILIKLIYHSHYMFTDTYGKFEVRSLASSSAKKCYSLVSYSTTNTRKTGQSIMDC